MDLTKREASIKAMFTCGICQNLIRNVTIIVECCHRFCKECITKKLTKEKLHHCPVCNFDLGCIPMQKLRKDYQWEEMRDVLCNKRRDEIERESEEAVAEKLIAETSSSRARN